MSLAESDYVEADHPVRLECVTAEQALLIDLGLGIAVPQHGYFDIDQARHLIGRAGWSASDWRDLAVASRDEIISAAEAMFGCAWDAGWGFTEAHEVWFGQAQVMHGLPPS